MAQAGQAVNQTCCAGSPQAQVIVAEGCPLQTCHQRITLGTANSAIASRWRNTRRVSRSNGDEPSRPAWRSVATAGTSSIVATSPGAYRRASTTREAGGRAAPWPGIPARRRMVTTSLRFRNIGRVPETVDKDG